MEHYKAHLEAIAGKGQYSVNTLDGHSFAILWGEVAIVRGIATSEEARQLLLTMRGVA
jgi:hypothetical protein